MSFTVQFLEQQAPASTTSTTDAPAACGVRRIARSHKPQRQAMRIHACLPPPRPPGEPAVRSAQVYIPYSGRSVLHKRIHANNLAAIGRTIELQKQTLELAQQTGQMSLQSAMLRQQTDAQVAMAAATDVIARDLPGRARPGFDPGLNDVKFSLIADIVAVAAHMMDKHAVNAESFLYDKLRHNTAPLIDGVRALLQAYKLEEATMSFEAAVEEDAFVRLIEAGMQTEPEVYLEINRRAGLLLQTMLQVAAADVGDGFPADDWPAPPDDDGTAPDLTAAGAPAQAARTRAASDKAASAKARSEKAGSEKARSEKAVPARAAAAKTAAPRAATRTAKKIAPRTRR